MKRIILIALALLVVLQGHSQIIGNRPPANTPPDDDKGQVGSMFSPTATLLFDNFNTGGVSSNPASPTTFTLSSGKVIVSIQTYHWNAGKGAVPGKISLRSQTGVVYGPWVATGSPGSGGVPNVFWTVSPQVQVPAGTYTIVDTGQATWSQNGASQNKGFAKVYVR